MEVTRPLGKYQHRVLPASRQLLTAAEQRMLEERLRSLHRAFLELEAALTPFSLRGRKSPWAVLAHAKYLIELLDSPAPLRKAYWVYEDALDLASTGVTALKVPHPQEELTELARAHLPLGDKP